MIDCSSNMHECNLASVDERLVDFHFMVNAARVMCLTLLGGCLPELMGSVGLDSRKNLLDSLKYLTVIL